MNMATRSIMHNASLFKFQEQASRKIYTFGFNLRPFNLKPSISCLLLLIIADYVNLGHRPGVRSSC